MTRADFPCDLRPVGAASPANTWMLSSRLVVICFSCTGVMRPRGNTTTTSTPRRPRALQIAAPPVSPEVPAYTEWEHLKTTLYQIIITAINSNYANKKFSHGESSPHLIYKHAYPTMTYDDYTDLCVLSANCINRLKSHCGRSVRVLTDEQLVCSSHLT